MLTGCTSAFGDHLIVCDLVGQREMAIAVIAKLQPFQFSLVGMAKSMASFNQMNSISML